MVKQILTKLVPTGGAAPLAAPLESLRALVVEQHARVEARRRAALEFEVQLGRFEAFEASVAAWCQERERFHGVWMDKTQVHHQALLKAITEYEAQVEVLRAAAAGDPERARTLERVAEELEERAEALRSIGREHLLQQIEGQLRHTGAR